MAQGCAILTRLEKEETGGGDKVGGYGIQGATQVWGEVN